jgi:hypothetical protein
LWGQKQERTPTWYGVFLENGQSTEAAQVMQYLWTGAWPQHRVPTLSALTIDGLTATDNVRLQENQLHTAQVSVDTAHQQALSYRWELMKELDRSLESDGGDFEPIPDIVWHQSGPNTSQQVEFKAPNAGEYRLFVYIDNRYGGSATANLPVLVESSGIPTNR